MSLDCVPTVLVNLCQIIFIIMKTHYHHQFNSFHLWIIHFPWQDLGCHDNVYISPLYCSRQNLLKHLRRWGFEIIINSKMALTLVHG